MKKPAAFPVVGSITFWLLLDRLKAPAWLFGVYWTLVFLSWAGVFYSNYKNLE